MRRPGVKADATAKRRAKRFSASHASASKFVERGLRNYFEYRDLGIARATRGKVVTHVIRARPGKAPRGEWHWHDCDVQFVYVLKGWARFEYEGIGVVLMKPGTCFYQPPRIRHRELAHSKDLQMIEVVSPAGFKTYSVKMQAKSADVVPADAAQPKRIGKLVAGVKAG